MKALRERTPSHSITAVAIDQGRSHDEHNMQDFENALWKTEGQGERQSKQHVCLFARCLSLRTTPESPVPTGVYSIHLFGSNVSDLHAVFSNEAWMEVDG